MEIGEQDEASIAQAEPVIVIDHIALEIEYYKSNRKEFLQQYNGKYLLIKGQQVIGVFNSNTEAQAEGASLHEVGTFIIEHPVLLKAR